MGDGLIIVLVGVMGLTLRMRTSTLVLMRIMSVTMVVTYVHMFKYLSIPLAFARLCPR